MSLKASDTPEICKKWADELPDDIDKKVKKDLEKALADAEKAIATADKKGDGESIEEALATLAVLASAANKTHAKCDKKKHKEVMAVLAKFEDVCNEEVERLEELKAASAAQDGEDGEDDEDEDDKGVFKEEYLGRMIKQLRSGKELNFCFGLDKQTPEDSRLVLCNKREPERLLKMVRRRGEFAKRLITFGHALGDGKVMELRLSENAKEPTQILKVAKKFFKGNKELKFKKLRVMCGGQSYEEDMDEEGQVAPDAANVAGGDLQQKLKNAVTANQTWKQARETVTDQIAQVRRELDAFDDPDVQSVRDRMSSVLDKYPNLDFTALAGAADQAAYDRSLAQCRQGIAEWTRGIQSDAALRAIDENPFGVNTSLVTTLDDSLRNISRDLQLA